tara:strand:+ start:508 stop:1665 length:1158 start_codon:yes stop_codon:yes gene_type:complete
MFKQNKTKQKSVLHIGPDYHNSFILRDKLRELGWKSDITCSALANKKLLYKDDVIFFDTFGNTNILKKILNKIERAYFLLFVFPKYKNHIYYGSVLTFTETYLDKFINFFRREEISIYLHLCKYLNINIIVTHGGCHDFDLQETFMLYDEGAVCNNCAWKGWACDDKVNNKKFYFLKKYNGKLIGEGVESSIIKLNHMKYKCIDLNLWDQKIEIPKEHILPKSNKLRILHSYFDGQRGEHRKNIKGSYFVKKAVEKLINEGFEIEYFYLKDKKSSDMRYYQAQADIVVEQLIYGWWGSTGVETMSLGLPVVCYLRKSWKEEFLKNFPEYDSLPIIESTTLSIYHTLKELILNPELRKKKGIESRRFAENHFDVNKNALDYISLFK